MDEPPRWRPTPLRRRLLIVALAVATAAVILLEMLQPQLRLMRDRAERRSSPPPCAPGQTQGCVGGTTGVIAPAAPASR